MTIFGNMQMINMKLYMYMQMINMQMIKV